MSNVPVFITNRIHERVCPRRVAIVAPVNRRLWITSDAESGIRAV